LLAKLIRGGGYNKYGYNRGDKYGGRRTYENKK